MFCHVVVLLWVVSCLSVMETVTVRPNFDNITRCATHLDPYMFDDEEYERHFKLYYNESSRAKRELVREEMPQPAPTQTRLRRDMYTTITLWPNATIPYLISCDYSTTERVFFANAMLDIESNTCIRFKPYTGEEPNFLFADTTPDSTSCSATQGVSRWRILYEGEFRLYSKLNIKHSCFDRNGQFRGKGTLTHELMHVLGFFHQHQRFDAGSQGWSPISEGKTVTYGPFDPNSAVSYTGGRTLTELDILKINRAYQCKTTTRGEKSIDLQLGKDGKPETTIPTTTTTTTKAPAVPSTCEFGGPTPSLSQYGVELRAINTTYIFHAESENCAGQGTCLLSFDIVTPTFHRTSYLSGAPWAETDKCRNLWIDPEGRFYITGPVPCLFVFGRANGVHYCIASGV